MKEYKAPEIKVMIFKTDEVLSGSEVISKSEPPKVQSFSV